jgi:hypothetical protein
MTAAPTPDTLISGPPDVLVLDRLNRLPPLGVALRDIATGSLGPATLFLAAAPPSGRPTALARNGRSIWFASRLPGLRDADLDPTAGSVPPRPYTLTVNDPVGQFLPTRLAITLPRRGLVAPEALAALAPDLSAALGATDPDTPTLPLFSSPARSAPNGCADIRGQLIRADTSATAAWALVTASLAGAVRAVALADPQGRFALFLPWPEWPRAALPPMPTSPPSSPPALSPPHAPPPPPGWDISISAYAAPLPASPAPDLADILAQLDHPRPLYASTAPLAVLPPQRLTFGQPLTLATSETAAGPSSFLVVGLA